MKGSVLQYNQILKNLKARKYAPVYLLMGEEPYFIDQLSDYLENNVLDPSEKEFNLTVLYGSDVNAVRIIEEAKRYPMMSERQVVIIKEAQQVKDVENLEPYFQKPLDSTILVLCHKYKKVDGRKSFGKTAAKSGIVFDSEKLRDDAVCEWVNGYIKEKGFTINTKAAFLLPEFLGNELGKISNELDKLMLNLHEGTEITPLHIEQFIGFSKDFNNFELQKAIGKKDIYKANLIISHFAKNPKDNPLIATVIILGQFFTKLLVYHAVKHKGKSELAKEMGVNPYFISDYEFAGRNYDMRKTLSAISCLREYDLKAKGVDSSGTEDGELLKELVWKLMH